MKRKAMTALMGGLLSVCLVGVGFASWVISQGAETSLTGNVKVEKVENKTAKFEDVHWSANNNTNTDVEISTNEVIYIKLIKFQTFYFCFNTS